MCHTECGENPGQVLNIVDCQIICGKCLEMDCGFWTVVFYDSWTFAVPGQVLPLLVWKIEGPLYTGICQLLPLGSLEIIVIITSLDSDWLSKETFFVYNSLSVLCVFAEPWGT